MKRFTFSQVSTVLGLVLLAICATLLLASVRNQSHIIECSRVYVATPVVLVLPNGSKQQTQAMVSKCGLPAGSQVGIVAQQPQPQFKMQQPTDMPKGGGII